MRLDYNILCIDDEIDTLIETKKLLKKHNDQVGIETTFVDIEAKPSAREVDPKVFKKRIFSKIESEFKNVSFDLIMVDLHLGASDSPMGFKGHEIIDYIRSTQTMYRPIVFYSSGEPKNDKTALSQLEADLHDNALIGKSIFVSSRGSDLNRHLSGICSEMHNEEHKLNASRGLLMDRSSEIDAKVLKYLQTSKNWEDLSKDEKEKLDKALKSELKRQAKNAKKKSEAMNAQSEKSFEDTINWLCDSKPHDIIYTLDSFCRNLILRERLRIHPKMSENGKVHSSYFKPVDGAPSISKIRNEYAHQTELEIGAAHDLGRCKFIRDELRKHLKNIELIAPKT